MWPVDERMNILCITVVIIDGKGCFMHPTHSIIQLSGCLILLNNNYS